MLEALDSLYVDALDLGLLAADLKAKIATLRAQHAPADAVDDEPAPGPNAGASARPASPADPDDSRLLFG
jgi:hypothetical protein